MSFSNPRAQVIEEPRYHRPLDANSENFRLESALRSYLDLERPNYAFLLNSGWGSGKTTFIQSFIESIRQGQMTSVYMSLFGLQNRNELDAELLTKLHPILMSKGGRLIGRLVGAATSYYKVDTRITLEDIVSKFDRDIFVFDDIERAEMPAVNVLGYINQFVEHEGKHVIILCDESKIDDKEEFRLKKEKVVGFTISVNPPLDVAFRKFLTGIKSDRSRDLIARYSDLIKDVFTRLETNNLRVLRQAMNILASLLDAIDEIFVDDSVGLRVLCQSTVALSIEVKCGRLTEDDVKGREGRFNRTLIRSLNKEEKPVTPFDIAQGRYLEVDLGDKVLSTAIFADIVFRSYFDKDAINSHLDRDIRFTGLNAEMAWVTVWHFSERPEASVIKAFHEMMDDIVTGPDISRGKLMQICSNLMLLSGTQLIAESREDLLVRMCMIARSRKHEIRVPELTALSMNVGENSGYMGLGFLASEIPEFWAFVRYLDSVMRQIMNLKIMDEVRKLPSIMKESTDRFSGMINYNHEGPTPFAHRAALHYIVPDEFVDAFFSTNEINQRAILLALLIRYDGLRLSNDLKDEAEWVMEVRRVLIETAQAKTGLTLFRIRTLLGWTMDKIQYVREHLNAEPVANGGEAC